MAMEAEYVAPNVVLEYIQTMFPYSYGLFFVIRTADIWIIFIPYNLCRFRSSKALL